MEAPKCKLCGTRHYGLCPTLPENAVKGVSQDAKSLVKPEIPAKKTAFDRNAYQKQYMKGYIKEYMRKYRAAKKC